MSLNSRNLPGSGPGNPSIKPLSPIKPDKKFVVLLLLAVLLSGSCKDELDLFNITRVPVFSFSLDNLNKLTAKDIQFSPGKSSLHYFPTGEVVLYNRYLMQVEGITTAGKKFTLSIELDLFSQTSFIGIYQPQYVPSIGGIYSFGYMEEVSANVFKSYSLDPGAMETTYFRVQKQNQDEQLILGDFFASLRNDQNTSEKLVVYQGTFNDIFYGEK